MRKRILATVLIILLTVAYAPHKVVYANPGITLVNATASGAWNFTGSATTFTCTLAGTQTAGNLVVVYGRMANPSREWASATDSIGGNTWSGTGGDYNNQSLGSRSMMAGHSVLAVGGAGMVVTVTLNGGASGGADAGCLEFSSTTGWPASPFDTALGAAGTTEATWTSGSISTAQAEEVIIGFLQSQGAARTITRTSGYSDGAEPATTSAQFHDEYKVTSSTFSGTIAVTPSSTVAGWSFVAIAYKNNASTSAVKIRSGGIY